METFEAIQAGSGEGRDDFVAAIESGMGHRGQAAGLVDQGNGLGAEILNLGT